MNQWNIDFGCNQHQGQRKQQQDFFAMTEPSVHMVHSDQGFLMVLADGMGGHSDGGKASVTAVQAFLDFYRRKDFAQTVPDVLRDAMIRANKSVYTKGNGTSDMGTTLVASVIQDQDLYWISSGDSRLYLFRAGRFEQLNSDHSYGATLDEKVRTGAMSPQEADASSKKRNMLTSYLGLETVPRVDLRRLPGRLQEGDKVLLCTDGLYNALSPEEFSSILNSSKSAQQKCDDLISLALSKRRPRQDNMSVLLTEIIPLKASQGVQAGKRKAGVFSRKTWLRVGIAAAVGLLAVAFGCYLLIQPGVEPISSEPTSITPHSLSLSTPGANATEEESSATQPQEETQGSKPTLKSDQKKRSWYNIFGDFASDVIEIITDPSTLLETDNSVKSEAPSQGLKQPEKATEPQTENNSAEEPPPGSI